MSCEMNLSIICGCLSGVRLVLSVLFPRYFSSSDQVDSRPATHGRTANTESFPFQPLSDISPHLSKVRDQKVEPIFLENAGADTKEQSHYAWARSSGYMNYTILEGAIGG